MVTPNSFSKTCLNKISYLNIWRKNWKGPVLNMEMPATQIIKPWKNCIWILGMKVSFLIRRPKKGQSSTIFYQALKKWVHSQFTETQMLWFFKNMLRSLKKVLNLSRWKGRAPSFLLSKRKKQLKVTFILWTKAKTWNHLFLRTII